MDKNYSILVVEDDYDFRELLTEALHLFDHNVTQADSGEAALSILENTNFDIMFTDVNMGGITGVELTERVRVFNQEMPIVILTGNSDRKLIEDSLKNGASDYILKPLHIKDLPVIIDRNINI